ncbi:hypothetical protein KC878_01990 [Candidatus Saccharibacteria bacterium]|nr:hypothetical protein [Candidatus Saccharibacteria bacterium]MCB9821673.1 hypothetical protein [Candidatus Nomurabacteria bacterium]
MGAVHAAMAGGAAGASRAAERAQRIRAELRKEFDNPDSFKEALRVWDDLETARDGSVVLSTYIPLFFEFLALIASAYILDWHNRSGDSGGFAMLVIAGCTILLVVMPFLVGATLDNMFFKKPAEDRIRLSTIAERVQEIVNQVE